ncbi:hypothetical protein AB0L63_05085 [Nocardia sp. NPDC051990]
MRDLNLAIRYHNGRIVAQGAPADIIDVALLRGVFDLDDSALEDTV